MDPRPNPLETLRTALPSEEPVARTNLAEARPGSVHEVVEVTGDDALARRLFAIGLWPGARLELLARAPFGDPLLFRLHGYRLALRRAEALRVATCLAGDAP